MKSVTLAINTITQVSPAGNRDFINIQNNDANNVYASFDSDVATAATGGTNPLTANNGWIIPGNGGTLFISNDGNRNLYNKPVYLLSVGGTAANAIRIQGEQ